MPIYEFYCRDCHRIYKFLSRRVDPDKRPACPKCGHGELERQVSLFATPRRRAEPKETSGEDGDEALPDIDEARLERALSALEGEAEGLDEDDPRQAARLMRKVYEATGLELGPTMQEAMRRMESGEDFETIEEELGDALEKEDPLLGGGLKEVKSTIRRLAPPEVDEDLYDL